MTAQDWEQIKQAYQLLVSTDSKRFDGPFWSIYKMGSDMRLDIKAKKEK